MSAVDSPRGSAPARWEREEVAVPANVAVLRHAVTGFARELGLPDQLVGDIALAVSEAGTNAVMHAYVDREPGRLAVVAEPAEDLLTISVVDDGSGMMPRSDSPGLGLGLPTIGQLTESFDIRQGPDGRGTEVRLVFAAPGLRAPKTAGGASHELELLAEVGRLAGTAWPGEGVSLLVELLVPALADACTIDLIEEGAPSRLIARIDGDEGGELSAWLAARTPPEAIMSRILEAMRGGEISVFETTPEANRELVAEEGDEERMAQAAMAWWVNVPLAADGVLLGSLGLGLRAHRPRPHDQLPFLRALGDRAARGLANTRLIDELRSTRRRLERILGALSEAVTVQDADRLVYANPAAAELLGADSVDEILRADSGELADRFSITREDGRPVALEDLPGNRLLAGEPNAELLTRSVHRATGRERWLLTKATLLDDEQRLAVNIIEDVTEAKNAERRQRFLAEASDLLASSLDYEQTLRDVARLAVPQLADWCTIDLLDRRGHIVPVALHHPDPAKVAAGLDRRQRYPVLADAPRGVGSVIRTGRLELIEDLADEQLAELARTPEHLDLLREVGGRSSLTVPLSPGGRVTGALSLVLAESGRRFAPEDVQLAEELARRASTAIENARLYTERTAVAETLRAGLLPHSLTPPPGYEVALLFRPAGGVNAVGGDFYDLVEMEDGWLAFVGDVAGKGVTAAAITARARYTLATAAQVQGDVPAAVRRLNDSLLGLEDHPLCSACCLTLDDGTRSGRATIVCAGHPAPIVLRSTGPEAVECRGALIGAMPDAAWDEVDVELAPGEAIVLYTDGVTDAVGAGGRFGEPRLLQVLTRLADRAPDAVIAGLDAALEDFQVAEQSDDIAVVVLRRLGG